MLESLNYLNVNGVEDVSEVLLVVYGYVFFCVEEVFSGEEDISYCNFSDGM